MILKIQQKIRPYQKKAWFFPLLLAAMMALAYGLQIFRLGFYWDDWQMIYLIQQASPDQLWDFYFHDRPFSIWTLLITAPILKTTPILWHMFTLIVRWFGALFVYWGLKELWPEKKNVTQWISLLFALYPGFSQQAVSVAYSQHFITYLLFTFSLWLMIKGTRKGSGIFSGLLLLSYLTAISQMLTMEYFFGLEFIRFPILWILSKDGQEKKTKRFLSFIKSATPFLILILGYFTWRTWIYPSMIPEARNSLLLLANFQIEPLSTFLHFIEIMIKDFNHLNIFTWLKAFQPLSIVVQSKTWFLSVLLGVISAAILVLVYSPEIDTNRSKKSQSFILEAIIIGGTAFIFGGLPVWITNRQIIVGLYSDRLALAPMLGVVILTCAGITWFFKHNRQIFVIGLLVAGALVMHIPNDNKYRLNWELQRQYYNQLIWRAPDLSPGTTILGLELPFGASSDYAVGFTLNALYQNEKDATHVDYWFLNSSRHIGNLLSSFEAGNPITYTIRNITYESDTSNSLGVTFNHAQGCLRVLDPVYLDAPDLNIGERLALDQSITGISFPDKAIISTHSENSIALENFRQIFGDELEHDWCYYFQKADLMRQHEEWDAVIEWMDQAFSKTLAPRTGVEYIPLIHAYAHTGQWDMVGEYLILASSMNSELNDFLLNALVQLGEDTGYPDGYNALFDEMDDLLIN